MLCTPVPALLAPARLPAARLGQNQQSGTGNTEHDRSPVPSASPSPPVSTPTPRAPAGRVESAQQAAAAAEAGGLHDTPQGASRLGTVRMFIRNESRGGCASPAGTLVSREGQILVITPNKKGPWGEAGQTVELREWNQRFRSEDPVITPKRTAALRPSDSIPPNRRVRARSRRVRMRTHARAHARVHSSRAHAFVAPHCRLC